uniref:Putative secreted peptide n=1 Tax=Anopheles braziliensis TaxID=58242 RepID=A0A2M3ZNK4_9DIPT
MCISRSLCLRFSISVIFSFPTSAPPFSIRSSISLTFHGLFTLFLQIDRFFPSRFLDLFHKQRLFAFLVRGHTGVAQLAELLFTWFGQFQQTISETTENS